MVDLNSDESRLVIFIILLILTIPSIICSIYIFYKFIRSQELRQKVNNHIVLLLLIICFIQVVGELPLSLIYLRKNSSALSSDQFCQFWIIFNYTFFTGSLWTMATASIERYWLVFHRTFFDKYILFLHYIPMVLCIIYPITLYTFFVIRSTCTNIFDYSYWTCGGACYLYDPLLGTLDWIVNGCIDVMLSTIATWIIIIRVLIQRGRIHTQRTVWQRSRRIIIQLISLSALYMIVWLPCVICFVITLFTPVPFLTAFYSAYLSYYQYVSSLLCPFVCLLGSPEIRNALRNNRLIQPTMNGIRHTTNHL